jgi:hypothetical protein
MASLVTAKQLGDRKRKLGQEPGKRFRGYGHKPEDDKKILSNPKNAATITMDELKAIRPKEIRETDFERAVREYLRSCAVAQAQNKPFPEIPKLVQGRYTGRTLRSWEKNILRTDLYRRVREEVQKTSKRARRAQADCCDYSTPC